MRYLFQYFTDRPFSMSFQSRNASLMTEFTLPALAGHLLVSCFSLVLGLLLIRYIASS
jgi:hypothetical protein